MGDRVVVTKGNWQITLEENGDILFDPIDPVVSSFNANADMLEEAYEYADPGDVLTAAKAYPILTANSSQFQCGT